MMIHFPGDPVRGEATQAWPTQLELRPNSGVFASILSALNGGWKAPTTGSEPLVSPEGSTSLNDHDAPRSDIPLVAPEHPPTDTTEKWASPPETVGLSCDNAARHAVPAGNHVSDRRERIEHPAASDTGVLVPDLPALDQGENQSKGVVPSGKTPLPDGGALATEQPSDRSFGAGHPIRLESAETSAAKSFIEAVTDPIFVSPSQSGQKLAQSAMSFEQRNGPTGTPTATNDGAARFAPSTPRLESPTMAPGTDPPAFEGASTKAEHVPYARSLGDERAPQTGVAAIQSRIDGAFVQPPPLTRGGERGGERNVPLSSAGAVSAPDAPPTEAVRPTEKNAHMTQLSRDMRRTEGPAPTIPSMETAPRPTPRTVNATSAKWNGAVPETSATPADLLARPAQRGITQAAVAWLASVDDGEFMAPSGGSLANQPVSALPQDLAAVQPRPAAEPARDVARQIGAQILTLGKGRFEMSLSPVELGRVEIWLHDSDNRLTLTINAERPETLDLIRRHIGLLEQEMRQLGYGGLSLQLGADGSPGPHTAQKPAASPGRHEAVGTAPEREAGLRPQVLSADHLDLRL